MSPDNSCSGALAIGRETPEYRLFREEMCSLQLLGRDGACRYYMSALTDIDHFALWTNEFIDNVREYIVAETRGGALRFKLDPYTVGFVEPYLKILYSRRFRGASIAISKSDRAVYLRLENPEWSDAQIAADVPTTIMQLERFTDYTVLRTLVISYPRGL